MLSDSVVLSGKAAIPARFSDWTVEIDGKAALMLKAANERLRARGKPVGSVAVMAIGYNSLWEKDRRNYDRWAAQFDKQADELLVTLKDLGAKKVVWVTLREPTAETVPAKAVKELSQYSWYFPYVNERLRALAERHPEVALADWTAVVEPERHHVRLDPPQRHRRQDDGRRHRRCGRGAGHRLSAPCCHSGTGSFVNPVTDERRLPWSTAM